MARITINVVSGRKPLKSTLEAPLYANDSRFLTFLRLYPLPKARDEQNFATLIFEGFKAESKYRYRNGQQAAKPKR